MAHKNVSAFSGFIDKSQQYWKNEKSPERQNYKQPVTNIIRKNRLICTKAEYMAICTIIRCYKTFKFRKAIKLRVQKRKILSFHQKCMKNMFKKTILHERQKSATGRPPATDSKLISTTDGDPAIVSDMAQIKVDDS